MGRARDTWLAAVFAQLFCEVGEQSISLLMNVVEGVGALMGICEC